MEILQGEKARPIIIIPDYDEDEVNAAIAATTANVNNLATAMQPVPMQAQSDSDDEDDRVPKLLTAAQRRNERREVAMAALREGHAAPLAIGALIAVAPAVVAAAVVVPPNPAVLAAAQADLARIDPGQQNLTFWNLIKSFKWHNASEGVINHKEIGNIKSIIVGWSPLSKLLFQKKYEEFFILTRDRLREDGMFERNNIITLSNIAKAVSHVIALGMESYNTLIEDLPFYQTLIEMQECQNLNDILPEEWRM